MNAYDRSRDPQIAVEPFLDETWELGKDDVRAQYACKMAKKWFSRWDDLGYNTQRLALIEILAYEPGAADTIEGLHRSELPTYPAVLFSEEFLSECGWKTAL